MSTSTRSLLDRTQGAGQSAAVLSVSPRSFVLASLAVYLLFRLLHSWSLSKEKRRALPPGPKGQAVLGVTKEMLDPSVKPWLRFAAWSKEHDAGKQSTLW